MDIAEVHAQALEATRAYVAAVRDDQWDLSTPCADWNVRQLVNHMVTGNEWAAELTVGKSIADVGDRLDGDILGTDPLSAYVASAERAAAAFRRPGVLEEPCAVSYGPVPGRVYAGHRFVDLLIHGWDLATATGQDATLDRALVEAALEVVLPQAELLAGSGMFGSPRDLGDAADPQARLLGLAGRAV